MTRILVVEDEPSVRELLVFSLSSNGFDCLAVDNAEAALRNIREQLPDLLLVDLMLPGMDGVSLIRLLRRDTRSQKLPIIILTARGSEDIRVTGLEAGADDFVVKPFSPRELAARIKSLLRRVTPALGNAVIRLGPFLVDHERHCVELGGRAIKLPPTEFKLLAHMAASPGRAYSREHLLDAVWGDHRFIETRTIDVNIRRLRNALGESGDWIETVRGIGYRMRYQ